MRSFASARRRLCRLRPWAAATSSTSFSHASDVLAGGPFERLNAPVLLSMMLDHIDRHSDDPSLSATTLARKFHCSERYVHKLFSKTGRSVGEHVNHKRILVCPRDLLGDSRNST